jgi:DNA-binding response OmpR family regulator
VLVVDDDPEVNESMCVLLELEGHQVRSASSGDAGIQLLKTLRPEVVLLDIGLPGEDGYSIARRMRALPEGRGILLLAVSGYGHEEAVARSVEAGFDRHLVKPVDPDQLRALLARFTMERQKETDASLSTINVSDVRC